jgi:hypothetical protein
LAGLYGAIILSLFAALLGGTPSKISGPTGLMTVVMAVIFLRYADQPSMAFTVVHMGGLLQILFGALRLGRYINLVPYPVVSGFMSGIGKSRAEDHHRFDALLGALANTLYDECGRQNEQRQIDLALDIEDRFIGL